MKSLVTVRPDLNPLTLKFIWELVKGPEILIVWLPRTLQLRLPISRHVIVLGLPTTKELARTTYKKLGGVCEAELEGVNVIFKEISEFKVLGKKNPLIDWKVVDTVLARFGLWVCEQNLELSSDILVSIVNEPNGAKEAGFLIWVILIETLVFALICELGREILTTWPETEHVRTPTDGASIAHWLLAPPADGVILDGNVILTMLEAVKAASWMNEKV